MTITHNFDSGAQLREKSSVSPLTGHLEFSWFDPQHGIYEFCNNQRCWEHYREHPTGHVAFCGTKVDSIKPPDGRTIFVGGTTCERCFNAWYDYVQNSSQFTHQIIAITDAEPDRAGTTDEE